MSSSSDKKHDVFLSFRGEDTRVGFTSHLYDALSKKSINTYIDYQLNRGDDVWPELAKAIEESHISVVVFSEKYATSKWCLEELVKILECRKVNGQVVIPVFYNTDPSDIRKQTGTYGSAFAKHERDLGWGKDSESNKQKVLKWRAALTEAANISGWDSQTHRDESSLIEKVVNDAMQKLQLKYPDELEGIVGAEKNCKAVETLIRRDVKVLGIWGMGGIGKTTIAKVVFAKLFAQYDHVCFADAKESSLSKLLSELLKEDISPSTVIGSTFHMRRLRSKKVFIVLDNVDGSDQFEYLCRDYRELSDDSRLIITTRDKQLLSDRVQLIYEVKQWEDPESLELFCLKAFKKKYPQKAYRDLSQRAVAYAGGIPLALEVLGSYLRSRGTAFWESAFRKLDVFPKQKIQDVLKVSYDGLDPLEKKIFLDIAFFFKGEKKDHVIRILDACGFEASSGIQVLEDKALITISNSNTIQMHDLLQLMGSDIISNGCGINPATHTRLRGSKALAVIKENKGTSLIEGITLDLSQNYGLPLRADTFTKMTALRILKFYIPLGQTCGNPYLNLPKVLKPFTDKLRYFEWIGYPFESLPQPFRAKLLVEIRMRHSNVKRLWQGIQELDKLEGIDLSECRHFVQLPDLSKAPRLKWVNLSGCESLCDLHSSVLCADTLVTLILDRCTNLRRVRGEKQLKLLEKISVNSCTSLEEFAVSSDLIENLDLSSTGIQTLDLSIGLLHCLKRLNLESLRLKHLPKELSSLKSIKELKISGSGLTVEKQELHELFDGSRSLQILYLKDFRNLSELPENISVLSQLLELRLDGSNVKNLPKSIKQLEELEILSLENCRELECLPELPPFIKLLWAVNCRSLMSVANLKILARKMMGKAKNISFKNSLNLEGRSLYGIAESLDLTMVSAAFHNVVVRKLRVAVHSYNYTSVEACLPGSRVPKQFKYRTTESSITLELPNRYNLLGFIYSLVLAPVSGMKVGTRIKCQCDLGEEGGIKVTWLNFVVTELKSDHVYVWYDPFHCDSILKCYEQRVSFKFCVTHDLWEVDGCIKECGVRLVSVEELQSVLPQLELDSDKKMELKKAVELESRRSISLTSIETSYEKENSGIINHSSDDTEPKSTMVEPETVEEGNRSKNHFSNVENRIGSTGNETKTNPGPGREEDITNFTDAFKSKGNEEIPSESDNGLHLAAVPIIEENGFEGKSIENNYDWQNIFEETKHYSIEENPNLQGEQIIVPDTNDLIIKQPEQEKENAPIVDLGKPNGEEDGSDEDLFAELDSILSENPESSPKATCSTSDVAIREALHNLGCLLESSLESILSDVELQRQLHVSLECIKQASHENVPPNVGKLVESMTSSIEHLFKDFASTKKVVQDHISRLQQKEKLMHRVSDAKKRKVSLKKEKSRCEDEAGRLEEEGKMLDEKIRILVEQKKNVELEKVKMKERLERCEGEKKKLDDEAKNMITESKELMSVIKNSTSSYDAALLKRQKLTDKWEGFKIAFAANWGS